MDDSGVDYSNMAGGQTESQGSIVGVLQESFETVFPSACRQAVHGHLSKRMVNGQHGKGCVTFQTIFNYLPSILSDFGRFFYDILPLPITLVVGLTSRFREHWARLRFLDASGRTQNRPETAGHAEL